MINETVPKHLSGSAGTVTNTMLSFGYMLCMGLGTILPQEDFKPGYADQSPEVVAMYEND